jgi:hypothetical protein
MSGSVKRKGRQSFGLVTVPQKRKFKDVTNSLYLEIEYDNLYYVFHMALYINLMWKLSI